VTANRTNARVTLYGQPLTAEYLGTKPDGSKHFMEIRFGKSQTRKWVMARFVKLHDGVTIRYIEKKTEILDHG